MNALFFFSVFSLIIKVNNPHLSSFITIIIYCTDLLLQLHSLVGSVLVVPLNSWVCRVCGVLCGFSGDACAGCRVDGMHGCLLLDLCPPVHLRFPIPGLPSQVSHPRFPISGFPSQVPIFAISGFPSQVSHLRFPISGLPSQVPHFRFPISGWRED